MDIKIIFTKEYSIKNSILKKLNLIDYDNVYIFFENNYIDFNIYKNNNIKYNNIKSNYITHEITLKIKYNYITQKYIIKHLFKQLDDSNILFINKYTDKYIYKFTKFLEDIRYIPITTNCLNINSFKKLLTSQEKLYDK